MICLTKSRRARPEPAKQITHYSNSPGQYERLTHFSNYPGDKASNPVVSDDGRFIAFQMAKSREAAGVGHGLFVYDVEKAAKHQ